MNNLNDFLDSLNLGTEYNYDRESNAEIVVELKNSNEYADVYNKLLLNNSLHETSQEVTTSKSLFVFTDGFFEVTLIAEYDNDFYKVIIGER